MLSRLRMLRATMSVAAALVLGVGSFSSAPGADTSPRLGAGDAVAMGVTSDPGTPVAAHVLEPVELGSGVSGATASDVTGAPLVPTAVAATLTPLLAGGALGSGATPARVIDVATGEVLYGAGGPATVPASTMKLVTAVSVLDALGADSHLITSVVLTDPDATAPRVVIVGGGDPSLTSTSRRVGRAGTRLTPASLAELARATARGLIARGITRVRVGYDASLFTGPSLHPTWAPGFPASGVVAPVSALQVDQGRRRPGAPARVADPAARTARVFADALTDAGVSVRGQPRQRTAPAGAARIAHVESPPVGVLVERMLATSDNDFAEALGRLGAAASGAPASFAGVATRAEQVLDGLAVDDTGARFADASGLSRRNRLAPSTLTDLLRTAATAFGSVQSGLPVAGSTGSLAARFRAPDERAARGVVRAKTGTLTGVAALAGFASRPDGRLLAFAFIDDSAPGGALGARAALDRAAAALVACDCAGP